MTAFATPPPEAQPAPCKPGSRLESCRIILVLTGDLLSIPFHLMAFLMTRTAHRRRFLSALEEGAAGLHAPLQTLDPRAETPRP